MCRAPEAAENGLRLDALGNLYFGTELGDRIHGLGGQDQLRGGAGDDFIDGGPGPDSLYGDQGMDEIHGGTGADVVRGGRGDDSLTGGEDIDMLAGDRDDDALDGGPGDDLLLGGPGDDSLTGGTGRDVLLGGEGADVAVYSDSPDGVTIFLDDTNLIVGSGGHAEGDILVGIEALTGSGHDDLIDGTNNSTINWLSGGSGDDALWGGGHDHADSLVGGPGNDELHAAVHPGTMEGGPGDDTFRFYGSRMDSDGEIRDFTRGEDMIVLDFYNGAVSNADLENMLDGSSGNVLDLSLLGAEFADFGSITLNVLRSRSNDCPSVDPYARRAGPSPGTGPPLPTRNPLGRTKACCRLGLDAGNGPGRRWRLSTPPQVVDSAGERRHQTMPTHPPEAQSGPAEDSTDQSIGSQPAHDTPEKLVRFQGHQDIPAIRIVAAAAAKPTRAKPRTRTPRQEARLVRLEETRQSRVHLGDTTPLPATPQGLYHWDQTDQIAALTEARLAEPETSFMMRLLALCSLPRTDPGDANQYIRTNGRFELVMARSARPGLPYGTVPRIVLAWMCTEAVRTRRRQLTLGPSFGSFLDKLDMRSSDSGGRHGVRTRLHGQMIRLFSASISLTECGPDGRPRRGITAAVVDAYDLWWDPISPLQAGLWDSQIVLGDRFFSEVLAYPVPIDMNVLRAMRRSPLGLDIYLWLTYRYFTLGQRETWIPWTALYDQFGARAGLRDNRTISAFRTDFLREMIKLCVAWPGLNYRTPRGYLVLGPTAPLISPSEG